MFPSRVFYVQGLFIHLVYQSPWLKLPLIDGIIPLHAHSFHFSMPHHQPSVTKINEKTRSLGASWKAEKQTRKKKDISYQRQECYNTLK